MLLQYVQHSLSSGGGDKHQADAAATAIRALNGVYRPRFSPMFHSFLKVMVLPNWSNCKSKLRDISGLGLLESLILSMPLSCDTSLSDLLQGSLVFFLYHHRYSQLSGDSLHFICFNFLFLEHLFCLRCLSLTSLIPVAGTSTCHPPVTMHTSRGSSSPEPLAAAFSAVLLLHVFFHFFLPAGGNNFPNELSRELARGDACATWCLAWSCAASSLVNYLLLHRRLSAELCVCRSGLMLPQAEDQARTDVKPVADVLLCKSWSLRTTEVWFYQVHGWGTSGMKVVQVKAESLWTIQKCLYKTRENRCFSNCSLGRW